MFLRWGRARILHGFGSHAVRCPISWDTHVDWSEVELGSFPHVLAGGHVMRSVGHFRPVASQEFVLRTDESVTGSDCGPSGIKTDATILTLFPAPALSRKFPVTLAVVANSAPDTSTLSAGHTNDRRLHSLLGITDNTAFANTQVRPQLVPHPSSPSPFCHTFPPFHLLHSHIHDHCHGARLPTIPALTPNASTRSMALWRCHNGQQPGP
ncbi:hypothetical protein EDB86DRAFT_2835712 [Lactarius hatsudake]|nr:hypothetical protein EDB86DRAFT_2835712 [Lactarius hatsudake]